MSWRVERIDRRERRPDTVDVGLRSFHEAMDVAEEHADIGGLFSEPRMYGMERYDLPGRYMAFTPDGILYIIAKED